MTERMEQAIRRVGGNFRLREVRRGAAGRVEELAGRLHLRLRHDGRVEVARTVAGSRGACEWRGTGVILGGTLHVVLRPIGSEEGFVARYVAGADGRLRELVLNVAPVEPDQDAWWSRIESSGLSVG